MKVSHTWLCGITKVAINLAFRQDNECTLLQLSLNDSSMYAVIMHSKTNFARKHSLFRVFYIHWAIFRFFNRYQFVLCSYHVRTSCIYDIESNAIYGSQVNYLCSFHRENDFGFRCHISFYLIWILIIWQLWKDRPQTHGILAEWSENFNKKPKRKKNIKSRKLVACHVKKCQLHSNADKM